MPRANSNIRILDMIGFGNIHSLRDANRRLGLIIDRALAGAPRAIRTRDGRFAVVLSAEAARALIPQASRPRSFADMFPVSELDPPVGRLAITHGPGRTRIVFPPLEHSADAKDKTDGDS